MKIALSLTPCECETLFQLSINHPWRDARLRASGLLMLGKGEHANAVGQQCGVSHQTIYNWRHAWEQDGLVGLISGRAGGRPKKLNEAWLATVFELARTEALTLRGLVRRAAGRLHLNVMHKNCRNRTKFRQLRQEFSLNVHAYASLSTKNFMQIRIQMGKLPNF